MALEVMTLTMAVLVLSATPAPQALRPSPQSPPQPLRQSWKSFHETHCSSAEVRLRAVDNMPKRADRGLE